MIISFPSDTTEYIDAIRSGIGRMVTFNTETKIPCSACGINPFTDTSVNPFCTVCDGVGYITTLSGEQLMAHITHGSMDTLNWVTGGEIPEGSARVQVKYTTVNWDIVDNAKNVIIDGVTYIVRNKTKRGFPQLNRIIVHCTEET